MYIFRCCYVDFIFSKQSIYEENALNFGDNLLIVIRKFGEKLLKGKVENNA